MPCGGSVSSPDAGPTLIHRAREVLRDIGWRRAIRVLPRWWICRRYLGLVADLEGLELDGAGPSEVRVTRLDAADGPALGALDPTMTGQEVARRVAAGQACLLGWWGRELVHYRWESTVPTSLSYLGRLLRPAPGDQIIVGIYTAPAFRGRGVASAVMRQAMERARATGVSRLVWLAAWWNTRSLGLAGQVGSRVVGTVGYWGLGSYRRYFATGRIRIERDGSVRIGESSGRHPMDDRHHPPSGRHGQR